MGIADRQRARAAGSTLQLCRKGTEGTTCNRHPKDTHRSEGRRLRSIRSKRNIGSAVHCTTMEDTAMEGGSSEAGPSGIAQTAIDGNGHVDSPSAGLSSWPLFYSVTLSEASIHPSPLSGSQDLLARLDLSGSYDRAVRPYLNLKALGGISANEGETLSQGQDIKGKGKASEGAGSGSGSGSGAGVAQVNGQTPADKARSIKKHYSHMIADVPGQNKLAKDHHLRDLLLTPDGPDHTKIIPFDSNALRDAFTLEVGVLPDFDTSIWRADAAEERKKKKKRKQDDAQMGGPAAAPSPAPVTSSGGTPLAASTITKKRKLEA